MAWKSKFCSIPDGREVICWDLDSTLRSSMGRRHLIPEIRAGRKTWDDYSMLSADDKPIEGAVALLRLLDGQVWNIAVSGSSVRALSITRDWCVKHNVPLADFLLRPDGDHTPNGEWKVAAVRRLQAAGLTVRLFVEDWDQTAKYIREQTGVPVLGVNPFDEGSVMITQVQLADAMARSGGYGAGNCGMKCAAAVFDYLGDAW